ncbi:YicC family protein [Suttonella sp. R2A3]|uniref:YicC/YloC family endoribonuclease n=1 Tax=Suttonella sp. R2A3 TaxID=2908648 RepID=UPI001F235729|nr:YicC/YloC family endoribonuclease [Suttonella sp. R2A3]UJF25340.1 YicC family protein [Suttonella sp. R2A3]
MTAFARVIREIGDYRVQIEMRSVNHRYLEFSPRLGEAWRGLEPKLRERLGKQLKRGKVDCWIYVEPIEGQRIPELNTQALHTWLERLNSEHYTSLGQPDWAVLLRLPGVLDSASDDDLPSEQAVLAVFDEVLGQLREQRAAEGEAMAAVINARLQAVGEEVAALRAHYPSVKAGIEADMRTKFDALTVEVDSQRFEQELVFLLAKADVDEELDRLDFHIQQTREALAQSGAVGRRLDFLMQEFNREANTLGSKSADAVFSRAAVNLKVLIEQMREQVQNIE